VKIETGVGFFDHMIEQVAAHGGFSIRLACEGDLHIDPHHTIEDCAIALGQALKQALGERRGIGRYGFVLPMDEAEAAVSIDLSGRPYPVFEGTFATPMLGDYRTDLTAHVVRSLAENLGAAVHVRVTGDDDHHKTEAVFKALGRALRQAIRVEGDVVPSTKGVLAAAASLLPLREKVACGAGRMRGALASSSTSAVLHADTPPSSERLRRPPSPTRGEER
jgi:imidazoleglycerol phosphate dehydratase HisB